MFSSIGPPEIALVVVLALLLFGSTQLPKLARSLGQAQKEFKQGLDEGSDDESDKDKDTKSS